MAKHVPINIGLIGYGYWGPNLLRNFANTDDCNVSYCADINPQALSSVKKHYPAISTTTDYRNIIKDKTVHAVVIATPVSTHYKLAKYAIKNGKDVLIEKPMADTSKKAQKLVDIAEKNDRILMVDHTFIYTPAVRRIKQLVDDGQLGKILYIDSVRIALGAFQHDVNVIFDLAAHDFSIIDYLLCQQPNSITASGIAHFGTSQENLAYILARYNNDLLVHAHVSWLSPVKDRTMIISGSHRMIVYDDMEPADKVRIYDKGAFVQADRKEIYQARIGYRFGDMLVPHLQVKEALSNVAEQFVACVKTRARPDTDGRAGVRVVKILEAATKSLRKGGKTIKLSSK